MAESTSEPTDSELVTHFGAVNTPDVLEPAPLEDDATPLVREVLVVKQNQIHRRVVTGANPAILFIRPG